MNLVPFNTSRVAQALQSMLRDSIPDATVERSEQFNETPSRCPWIGIYRVSAQYPTRALGMGSGMRQQRLRFMLLAQHADMRSGEGCEESIEDLVQRVLSALLSDTTLGGTVSNLDSLDVQYTSYQKTAGNPFVQTASIYVTFIGGIQ